MPCKVSPSKVKNLHEKNDETGSMNERNGLRIGALNKSPQSKTEHLYAQASTTDLKQLPCTDADGTRRSVSTIKKRLKEGNINGRVARKKPLISEVNAQDPLKYA